MSSFRPLPFLGNPHVQTILGTLLPGFERPARTERRVVALPDGDRLVLHETPPRTQRTQHEPIALMVHGLGGSYQSGYNPRMAAILSARGWRVFRVDLRGAGAGVRLARKLYCAGCSGDVAVVVESLAGAFPHSPITLIGFSLGGNIVLKYAGEAADTAPANLAGVVAVAPPIDLLACSALIAHQPMYDAFYVHNLVKQATRQRKYFPDMPKLAFPARMILREFDDMFTAPNWGFRDSQEYYRESSSFPLIDAIRIPAFVLTARDDPFIAVEPFEKITPRPGVEVHIADKGGHMGFLGVEFLLGVRWAERKMVDWLARHIESQCIASSRESVASV